MLRHTRLGLCALGLLVLGLAAPATAADPVKLDKHLPDDTETIIGLNVRQVLDSALVKKYGLEPLKQLLEGEEEVKAILKELGFDPLKDLDSVLLAAPGGQDQEKGLIIFSGRFDVAKFTAKAEQVAKDMGDHLKVHKAGDYKLYEVIIPDQPVPFFVALADKNTILASPSKDYVVDGLDKNAGKKKTALKSKELQGLLAKVDTKQSLWMAIPAGALPKELPIDNDKLKKALESIEAISGGVNVTDEVKVEFLIAAKDADGAKGLVRTVNDGLTQAKGLILLAGGAQLQPLADLLGTVKVSSKDKAVSLTCKITADVIEKLSMIDK